MSVIKLNKAVEPLTLEFTDGESITVLMDLKDGTLDRAYREIVEKSDTIKIEDVYNVNTEEYAVAIAQYMRDIIELIIGEEAYLRILNALGEGLKPEQVNIYMVNVYLEVAGRAIARHRDATESKAMHYLSEVANK